MDRPRPAFIFGLLAVALSAATVVLDERGAAAPEAPIAALTLVPEARAAEALGVSISSCELPSGGLMAFREGVKLGPFTLERTEVKADVSGAFASVEVSQVYANPGDTRLEAVYVFPLPEDAAVTDMYMRISSRVITSEVQEREQARKTYEAARSSGQATALLEQERPNIFTQSVANIPPGERVFIQIKYVHALKYDEGRYRFVFPMVVGPRYIPGAMKEGPDSGLGWSADTHRAPDASRITPHPLLPGERSGHDIQVRVQLHGGLPIRDLTSVSHPVSVVRRGQAEASVSLRPFDTVPNKDFVLEWGLRAPKPDLAVLAHRKGPKGDGYLLLLVQPQPKPASEEITPKEMVFVVDTSGSMSGEPIAKVKEAMRKAIAGMNPSDSFQIIRFDQKASQFSPLPLPNTPENIRAGLSYINNFQGAGGTEMLEGIKAALDYPEDPKRRRIVFFMTDGYIGNDDEIVREAEKRLRGARLFSFGVGSSVNRYLLDRLAQVGRGFTQYVRHDEDSTKAVELFYKRIRNPLLMDPAIDWGGLPVTGVYPPVLPDLFDHQPLLVFARYTGAGSGTVRLTGRYAGRKFERSLALELPGERAASPQLRPLWARRQVEALMLEQVRGEKPEVKAAVLALGLEHKLMTAYTSFVAVERVIRQDVSLPLTKVLVPVEMPEGVSYDGVFGRGAVVSIPRMKPGDPVVSVPAPAGTAAVIAEFRFGERKLCRYDRDTELWGCRFLVPRGAKDGVYLIKLACVGQDGRVTSMVAEYVVDSQAPIFEVTARRASGGVLLSARPKSGVLERRGGRTVHDVKRLVARLPDGRRFPLKLVDQRGVFEWRAVLPAGAGRATVEAVDYAGNESRLAVGLP